MKLKYIFPIIALASASLNSWGFEISNGNEETNAPDKKDTTTTIDSLMARYPELNSIPSFANTKFAYLDANKDYNLNWAKKGFSLDFTATQFTRDAEYFLPETKGYTAVGFMATPTVKYITDSKYGPFAIEAGGHVLGIAGDDHRLHLNPVFRIEYQPKEWLHIIGGTIYGNLNHGLYEPMYDFDRYFYNNQEDGLQLLIGHKMGKKGYFSSDTWLNWENFLEPGEAEQEKFTIGSRNEFCFSHIKIPLHIMGTHRGGQFSALQDTCLETIFNACTGFDWEFFHTNWRLTGLVFGYKNNSNEVKTPYKDGFGIYPMITYQRKNMALIGGYWYGNGYIGSRGSHLFMSVSKYDPLFAQKERKMITGKWYYQHGIFGLDAQAYYDLDESKCDFAFGLYLKLDATTRYHRRKGYTPDFKF